MAETYRVLVRKEAEQFVAQCLEVDVCVQALDFDTLEGRLEVALQEEDLTAIGKAPQYFFDIWETGRTVKSKAQSPKLEMKMAA